MDKDTAEETPEATAYTPGTGTVAPPESTAPPRVQVRERVTLRYDGESTFGLLKNLSVGGMYVECDERFTIGITLEAIFTVEETGDTFDLQCRVIHTDRHGIGTRFLGLSPDDQKRLTDLTYRPEKPKATPVTRDRRIHPRVPVRGHISLTSGPATVHGWVTNLSTGGLFLECGNPFPPEVECELTFTLRDEVLKEPLQILTRCWVAHANEQGMGVQFDELDPATKSELQRAVNAILYASEKQP